MRKNTRPTRDPQLESELLEHDGFKAIHTDERRGMPEIDVRLFCEEIREYIAQALEFQEWYLNETIYIEDKFEEDHSSRRQFYVDLWGENPPLAGYVKSINALGRGFSATVSSQLGVVERDYIGLNRANLSDRIRKVTGLVEEWTDTYPGSFAETMEYVREIKNALYEVLNFLSEQVS